MDLALLWKEWIDDKNRSAVDLLMKGVLGFASLFYGTAVKIRNLSYNAGARKAHRIPVPVISIGNLSVGGTGKTPLVLWCAQTLRARKKKVVILSRGYGRYCESETVVVSDGEKVLSDSAQAGDEPIMLARKLKDVPIVAGADRVRSARLAIQKFNPDVLILDDGFQHRRIARDLDILCFDEHLFRAPYLFPRGLLREPLPEIIRADFAVIKSQNAKILNSIEIPRAFYKYRIGEVRDFASGALAGPDWLNGRKVFAASAIAHPEDFESLLAAGGAQIVGNMRFPDHFFFRESDLEAMIRESKKNAGALLMTDKDSARLPGGFPAYIAGVEMEWMSGSQELERMLLKVSGA